MGRFALYKYDVNTPVESTRISHLVLVGPPIAITLVFCFVMVLMSTNPSVPGTHAPISTQSPLIITTQQPALTSLVTPTVPVLTPLEVSTGPGATSALSSSPQPAATVNNNLQAANGAKQTGSNNTRPLLNKSIKINDSTIKY